MTQLAQPTNEDEVAKRLAEAKEARKRAKEKARSMHARIFRKKDEPIDSSKNKLKANTTSNRHGDGGSRNITSKPTFVVPMKKVKKMRQSFRMSRMGSTSSMSSISEDEAFDGSAHSSLSSLTQLSNSGSSFNASFSGAVGGFITQGPSQFDAAEPSCHAPKMPSRHGVDEPSCHAPRMPSRPTNFIEQCHGSGDSLSLDELVGETSHGREWSDKRPPSSEGVSMPVRRDSFNTNSSGDLSVNDLLPGDLISTTDSSCITELESSSSNGSQNQNPCSGTSTSGFSFYTSSSSVSSGADTFALHQAKARRAV